MLDGAGIVIDQIKFDSFSYVISETDAAAAVEVIFGYTGWTGTGRASALSSAGCWS